ncbi:MAG: alpha-L-fucosidase, partial [Clostridiales bacterium]|nr:alpha-L-fucosidase [Clostridiales bacterium]
MNTEQRTAYLNTINQVATQGPYDPTWESLTQFTVPQWYRNAKFGIFIHWGVY